MPWVYEIHEANNLLWKVNNLSELMPTHRQHTAPLPGSRSVNEGGGAGASVWSGVEWSACCYNVPWPPPVTAAMSSHAEDTRTTLCDPNHLPVSSSFLGNCVLQWKADLLLVLYIFHCLVLHCKPEWHKGSPQRAASATRSAPKKQRKVLTLQKKVQCLTCTKEWGLQWWLSVISNKWMNPA